MTSTFGSETLQNGRYRLSFTVGGLLASQGQRIASLYLRSKSIDTSSLSDSSELGEHIDVIRKQAISDNVLAIRTAAANLRMVREVIKRLSALTLQELQYLANDDTPAPDRRVVMWVAMCRYYALVGEFANEVLRDHLLADIPTLTYEDYDRFVSGKSMWHPELETLSNSTAKKLRQNVFRALYEANLLNKSSNAIVSFLLSHDVTDILVKRPASFGYFPMREPLLSAEE
jgi:hypothetical protein